MSYQDIDFHPTHRGECDICHAESRPLAEIPYDPGEWMACVGCYRKEVRREEKRRLAQRRKIYNGPES
jgi:hypothetical protein